MFDVPPCFLKNITVCFLQEWLSSQVDYIKILGENRMFKTNKLVFAEGPGRSPPYADEGSGIW